MTVYQKIGEWYYLGQDAAKNNSYAHQSVLCDQVTAPKIHQVLPKLLDVSPGASSLNRVASSKAMFLSTPARKFTTSRVAHTTTQP